MGATTAEIRFRVGRPVRRGIGIGTMLRTRVSRLATMFSRFAAGMATSAVVRGGRTARARISKGLFAQVAGVSESELCVERWDVHGVLWYR